jgi:electron transfer flavoprotein beta subunit
MNIAVIVRQVPDLVEEFEIDQSGIMLDPGSISYVINESDSHALEEAILLKEKRGAVVTVFGMDFGQIDDALFNGAARGADKLSKIVGDFEDANLTNVQRAEIIAQVLQGKQFDLILMGQYATDELDTQLAPLVAAKLKLPFIGGTRGLDLEGPAVIADKEFPGAIAARTTLTTPAFVGVLTAGSPPRYVPVSKLRSVMKTSAIEEIESGIPEVAALVKVQKMYFPEAAGQAEMLEGDVEEIAGKIVDLLSQRGLLR